MAAPDPTAKALSRIDQDVVTKLAVDLVSIPSPTGSEPCANSRPVQWIRTGN